jgi:outer membrane protein TolC
MAIGARDVSAEFLKLSQKQLELGALSPLDIYNPQQQLATNEVSVAQARFTLTQREDALRKQISADLDPQVRNLPMVLTDSAEMALDSINFEKEASIQQAMQNRPDLKQATQTLDVDDLSIQQARNGLAFLCPAVTRRGTGILPKPTCSTGRCVDHHLAAGRFDGL